MVNGDQASEVPARPAGPPAGPYSGPRREGGPGGPGGPGGRRRRYAPRRKVCLFCVDKVKAIDYKDPNRLRRFLSDLGKMDSRRKTGTCAHHQRQLTQAVKRARHLALLPFTASHIRQTGVYAVRGGERGER